MFSDLKELPCKERFLRLGLRSLEERRNRADLIELFKMVKDFSAVSWSHFFTRSDTNITRGHNWRPKKTHNQSDIRFHLFSQRSINRWNSLAQEPVDAPSINSEGVDAPSINSFKNHLEKLRIHQMDFFMDWREGVLSSPTAARPRIDICQVLHQL